jgi:hypothetical protein
MENPSSDPVRAIARKAVTTNAYEVVLKYASITEPDVRDHRSEGRRRKAVGGRRKAEGRRQKTESGRQKAEGGRRKGEG